MSIPIQVSAQTPEMLFVKVMEELTKGNDLYTQPFIAFTGEIVQYMVASMSLYEYRLIEAADLDDLDDKVHGLAALGFDFIFSTVQWNASYLQWMYKMNEKSSVVMESISEQLWTAEDIIKREG